MRSRFDRTLLLLTFVAALGSAASACRREAPAPSPPPPEFAVPPAAQELARVESERIREDRLAIAAVLIADLTSDEDRPLDLARELEDVVRAAWKGGTELAWAPDRPGEEGGFEIRAAYVTLLLNDGEPLAGAGEGEAYVAVHATATREAGGVKVEVYEEEERITAPFRGEKDALRQVLLAELAEVTGKVRARLAARIKAHHATDAELVRALTSGRPVERSQAAVEAGERRLEAAIPALIEALEADDAMLVIRAAGALGSLGDDRATRPLAGLTASNDDDVLSAAVYALGDIGTPLARRYLQEMAESHAYATVRDKASEVLGKN